MVEGTACLMVTREKEKGEGEEGAKDEIPFEVSALTIPSSLNDCIHEPSTCKPEDTILSLIGGGNLEL